MNELHNPANLTPEQVDPNNEGWRLITKKEREKFSGNMRLNEKLEAWRGMFWENGHMGYFGNLQTIAYRTKEPLPEPNYTSKEHHLECYKAWQDGADIEAFYDNKWNHWHIDGVFPSQGSAIRIKPEPTQEEIDQEAWQKWEKQSANQRQATCLMESNLIIWQAALKWERSK